MSRKLLACALLASQLAVGSSAGLDEYGCSFCVSSVERAVSTGETFIAACEGIFPQDICEWTFADKEFAKTVGKGLRLRDGAAREMCELRGRCESLADEAWRDKDGGAAVFAKSGKQSSLDIRVSKAYGSRGYDKVRVSVISSEALASDVFTYSEPFKYKWTQYYLNTGI